MYNNPDFSPHFLCFSVLTCQISGRNFFQVGDDVTTRTFTVRNILSYDFYFSILRSLFLAMFI
ncbi:hypothetical protein Hanom_Chr03g00214911 [Helianthus anomalus]